MAELHVVNSYRYLRLAMVVVTLTVGISLVYEIVESGCLLGSVSAFYYTPVHSMFVGGLFVVGVALVALIGRDTLEDLFFNFAGFLAPVVALVPGRFPTEACADDGLTALVPIRDRLMANNAFSLLVGFAVALGVAVFLATRSSRTSRMDLARGVSRANKIGIALSALVLIAGFVWSRWHTDSFEVRAHGTAAILMFVSIWLAILVNADFGWLRGLFDHAYRFLGEDRPDPSNPKHETFYRPWYRRIAIVMAAVGIIGGLAAYRNVDYAVFWLEVLVVIPFAGFWILQTAEGWHSGSTSGTPAAPS